MKTVKFEYDNYNYIDRQLPKYEQFENGSGHWNEKWKVMEPLMGNIDDSVLVDLGCSIGSYTLKTRCKTKISVGIDFSINSLRSGKELAAKEDSPGLASFVCGDVSRLCIRDESVDVVLGVDIVEHLPPPVLRSMLEEAFRVLKKGGRVVLHTYPARYSFFFFRLNKYTPLAVPALLLPAALVSGYLEFILRCLNGLRGIKSRIKGYSKEQSHCNCQTPGGLVSQMEGAGFVIEKVFCENTYSEYERTSFLKMWEKGMRGHEVTQNNIYVSGVKK